MAVYWPLGGSACQYVMPPQQVTVPSVLSAHECEAPAVMAVYWPLGGSACPNPLLPQQAMVPSVLSAHECA